MANLKEAAPHPGIPFHPNIDAFSQIITDLSPEDRARVISHDIPAYIANIASLAGVVGFTAPAPVYSQETKDEFMHSAIPYIYEVHQSVKENTIVLEEIKKKGKQELYLMLTDIHHLTPILLHAAICAINPTVEEFTLLENSRVSIQALARNTNCDMRHLPSKDRVIPGSEAIVVWQYMNNAKKYKEEDTVHEVFLNAENSQLVIQNITPTAFLKKYKETGVTSGRGSSVGLKICDAFSAAAGIPTDLIEFEQDEKIVVQAIVGLR